jgi:hypothetical protein
MESLALLIQHGAKDYSDPDEEDVEDSKELEGRNRNSNNSSRLERDMLFRRIEQEVELYDKFILHDIRINCNFVFFFEILVIDSKFSGRLCAPG